MKGKLATILVQGREFVTGKSSCPVCKHRFRFVLTKETMVLWEGYCSQCTAAFADLPPKGKIMLEGLNWD